MKHLGWVLLLVFLGTFHAKSQLQVEFPASDGLLVTADLYGNSANSPYILLFHQAGSSRGEFPEIARRLVKIGYNALAVDLRSGNEMQYIPNQTARRARDLKLPSGYLDSRKDIAAAIEYAWNMSKKEVVLLGSSYSASLCLMEAKTNSHVRAVIAFSPGEYFGESVRVASIIAGLKKPVFAAGTKMEAEYLNNLLNGISQEYIHLISPSSESRHGASALWANVPASDELWLQLMFFFKGLSNE